MKEMSLTYDGRKLTDIQAKWFDSYMQCGNATQAARDAGIETGHRQRGYELKQGLHGLILLNMRRLVGNCAPSALETIFELSKSCEDPKVRLAAAKDLLDRAGYREAAKVEITIADKTDFELDSEIKALLAKGDIIEATDVTEI